MPFPLSAHGIVTVESIAVPQAMSAVEAMLREVRASEVVVHEGHIAFTVRFFRFVMNWNLLVAIDSGGFTFRPSDRGVAVEYQISFVRMLVLVTIMVGFMFGLLPVLLGGPQARVPLPVLGFAWLWLFGVNYLITIYRFPSALRSSLHAQRKTIPAATFGA